MNRYLKIKDLILKYKCQTCTGLGTINDAEPGDISFNTTTCPACKGTGMTKTVKQIAALIGRLTC